jgi:hypothetical protein
VSEAAKTTSWAAALDELADLLDRNEQDLAADDWTPDADPAPAAPAAPVGVPTAAERARAAALRRRAADQERRLRAEREATGDALGELGRRRQAARRYTE